MRRAILSWAERKWIDLFVDAIELVGLVHGTSLLLWQVSTRKVCSFRCLVVCDLLYGLWPSYGWLNWAMTRRSVEEKEEVKKGRKRQQKRDEKEAGLFQSAPCLILLASLASVAVAAIFGVCTFLCMWDFLFNERRKKKKYPLSLERENRSAVATSEKNTCFDTGKIIFCHCAAVLQTQVPKLCVYLDHGLLYILILKTYSKFARENHFLALGVCSPQPCSSAGRRFAASRSRLQNYRRIVSFPQQKNRWNAL